jgi:excisionase family DNA binding protein
MNSLERLIGMQLSVPDVAAVLNAHRCSVERAIRNKKLKAWKLDTGCNPGGSTTWRVRGEDLIEYMDQNSNWR